MNRLSPLKSLPGTLLGMLVVFAAMPVLSIPMAGLPWDVYRLHGEAHAALVVFAFWLAPLGLCAAILRRHFLFVPLFLAECFALILNVAMASDAQPVMAKVLRYSLVLVMAGVGVLFVNKDFYFPFLSKRVRFWRRNPRLSANAIVVVSGEAGERLNMMMEDCSATGMAVCGEREPIKAVLKNKPKDAVVNVAVSFRGTTTRLACALAWTQDVGGIRRLGLRITDEDLPKMQAVITAARGESRTPVVAALSKHWVKSSVQRTVMILWGTSVFASYAMPACGTSSQEVPVAASAPTATATSTSVEQASGRSQDSSAAPLGSTASADSGAQVPADGVPYGPVQGALANDAQVAFDPNQQPTGQAQIQPQQVLPADLQQTQSQALAAQMHQMIQNCAQQAFAQAGIQDPSQLSQAEASQLILRVCPNLQQSFTGLSSAKGSGSLAVFAPMIQSLIVNTIAGKGGDAVNGLLQQAVGGGLLQQLFRGAKTPPVDDGGSSSD